MVTTDIAINFFFFFVITVHSLLGELTCKESYEVSHWKAAITKMEMRTEGGDKGFQE